MKTLVPSLKAAWIAEIICVIYHYFFAHRIFVHVLSMFCPCFVHVLSMFSNSEFVVSDVEGVKGD